MRIEKRTIDSSEEMVTLVGEVLEGEIKGFRVIDQVDFTADEIEIGLLASDDDGRVLIVVAKEKLGDSLLLSYGKHVVWLKARRETLSREHPTLDWDGEPGIVMLSETISAHVLLLVSMLVSGYKMCYSMKCLGIGKEKGLYLERIEFPEIAPVVAKAPREVGLLSNTVNNIVSVADGLSLSASFGYLSKSLDWVPVANLRSHRGTIWVESGPGTWSAKRIEDENSLESVVERVKKSYEEVLKTKGEAKDLGDDELSEAERKSLKWD